MSEKLQAPKGTADVLPSEVWRWQAVENIARVSAELFGFGEIRTPIFEHTELFHRGVGQASDIVQKETYTFEDRGGRSMTLRPEGTAGVVRAMIEHNLLADQGARAKVYYIGPNFRFERPQSGRLRQHHQFGAEAFGVAEPEQDVECVLLQMDFYRRCGVKDLELKINSLGDRESKSRYRDIVRAYLLGKRERLSEESRLRLEANPLRILDSKDPADIEACVGMPAANDSLSEKSRVHLHRVMRLLSFAQVRYKVDNTLVRGFDYYTDTLWEITAAGLGAQNALGGGGRYDNLVEELGGRPTPAVGFGSGLERLLIALESQKVKLRDLRRPLVWIATQGEAAKAEAWPIAAELRSKGIVVDMDLGGRGMKGQFKLADRAEAAWCVIIGDAEVQNQTVALKNMKSGEQISVARSELVQKLSAG